jgi:hypothetical protein
MAMVPFSKWPSDPHARWVQAANTFGRHLMAAARDYAFGRIPESAPPEVREAAEKAALDAIYGVMMLLDGVANAKMDKSHRVEYALFARVRKANQPDPVEQFELAPDGDGLCMGYHGWVAGHSGGGG